MCNEEQRNELKKIDGIGDITANMLLIISINNIDQLMSKEMFVENYAKKIRKLLVGKIPKDIKSGLPSINSLIKIIRSANTQEWMYSKAKKRFDDLVIRTFRKLYYYWHYYTLNKLHKTWRDDNYNPNKKITETNWGNFSDFMIKFNDSNDNEFRQNLLSQFRNDYKDKKLIVGKRNQYIGKMENMKYSDSNFTKENFNNYFENYILNWDGFKNLYHKDSDNNKRKCKYCGITEEQIQQLLDKNSFKTKRIYTRGKSIEIDQRNPNDGYNRDNINLVCYWCNNAKTDEFTAKEFKPIGDAIRKAWNIRLTDAGLDEIPEKRS